MAYLWTDPDAQDLWTLSTDESALMAGMTDKGKLGFAAQLKFMEQHGRFPERHDEIDPNAMHWLTLQLGATAQSLPPTNLAVAKGNGIEELSALSLVFAQQPALTCNSLVSGCATKYCRSTRKPATGATLRSTGVVHSASNRLRLTISNG